MEGLVKAIVLGMSRDGVMALGAWVAAHGYLSGSDVTNFEGSLIFLAGAAFSIYDKFKVNKQVKELKK